MRILDLGCGIGDVSLIAARIVGPRGSVTGLDPDGAALDTARARANQEGLAQVTFQQTAFETYTTDCLDDAVLGRHVLFTRPTRWVDSENYVPIAKWGDRRVRSTTYLISLASNQNFRCFTD